MKGKTAWVATAAVVLVHFGITVVHGVAHTEAHVSLSTAANIFVFTVILAGPLVGLAVTWWSKRFGAWLVTLTMAGALLFGFIMHFVLESPDHISQVDPTWRTLFTATAVLLALTEALGAGLAFRFAQQSRSR